jgi:nitrate reductase NapAB chaperone NapD
MPIKSYLAYPRPARREELARAIEQLPGCQLIQAENQDLFILITETPDEESEQRLEAQLESIPDLAGLALVSGFNELIEENTE